MGPGDSRCQAIPLQETQPRRHAWFSEVCCSSSPPGEVANLRRLGPGSDKLKLRGVRHVEMLCFHGPNPDEVWAFLKNQDGWTGKGPNFLDRPAEHELHGRSLAPFQDPDGRGEIVVEV